MKSQIELAKEKGIEVGDRVKVVRKYEIKVSGEWPDWMDDFIGLEVDVAEITEYGIVTKYSGVSFPVQSLEKVATTTQPTIEEVAKLDRAFPHSWSDGNTVYHQFGVTKREYFAAMAMQGLATKPVYGAVYIATEAVRYADALIAELNKGEGV